MPVRFVGPLRVELVPAVVERGGPLEGVTLAIKDVIDFAGVPTGAGNPAFLAAAEPAREHAVALSRLLDAGAQAIGKSHTDELAFSLAGTNVHYGTPLNPGAPGRVPGGSSSGSAAAVAGGLAQIALGTDTGGRLECPPRTAAFTVCALLTRGSPWPACSHWRPRSTPAACSRPPARCSNAAPCACWAQRAPTPPTSLVLGADLMAEADGPVTEAVRQAAERLARRLAVPLTSVQFAERRLEDWLAAFRGRQLVEAWRAHGEWIDAWRPPLGPGVAARFAAARATPEREALPAGAAAAAVLEALERVLPSGGALVMPSAATVAPWPELAEPVKADLRRRTMRLTCVAGLAGAPAVSLPLASVGGLPVGLCLLARPGEDERLLAAAGIA